MSLDQYSIIISLGLIGLSIVTVASMGVYVFSRSLRAQMLKVDYMMYLQIVGALALVSTLGALAYQMVFHTPVCEYCWWQRVFMFPIIIITSVSLWKRLVGNELIIAILALIGAGFSVFQYYFHFQINVLDNILSMPCSGGGIIPSCTETPILIFGFITIPLMALIVFISIMWLSYLAYKTR